MNRQVRRAQEKADQKKDREKLRARKAKRERKETKKELRREKRAAAQASRSEPRLRQGPFNRFSGVFLAMTTVFIVLQAVVPRPVPEGVGERTIMFNFATEVLYYLLFSYILYTFLLRRNVKEPLYLSLGIGVALTLALLLVQAFIPAVAPNYRLVLFAVPAVIAGSFTGRWVASKM